MRACRERSPRSAHVPSALGARFMGPQISPLVRACYAFRMPTPQSLLEALKQVKYPGFSRDIVSFGLVKDIQIGARGVTVELAAISANDDVVATIRNEVAATITRETQLPVDVRVEQAPRR